MPRITHWRVEQLPQGLRCKASVGWCAWDYWIKSVCWDPPHGSILGGLGIVWLTTTGFLECCLGQSTVGPSVGPFGAKKLRLPKAEVSDWRVWGPPTASPNSAGPPSGHHRIDGDLCSAISAWFRSDSEGFGNARVDYFFVGGDLPAVHWRERGQTTFRHRKGSNGGVCSSVCLHLPVL